jgi:hypothetical protein
VRQSSTHQRAEIVNQDAERRRFLGWLGGWQRLSTDYEELPEVSEVIVALALIQFMLERLITFETDGRKKPKGSIKVLPSSAVPRARHRSLQ